MTIGGTDRGLVCGDVTMPYTQYRRLGESVIIPAVRKSLARGRLAGWESTLHHVTIRHWPDLTVIELPSIIALPLSLSRTTEGSLLSAGPPHKSLVVQGMGAWVVKIALPCPSRKRHWRAWQPWPGLGKKRLSDLAGRFRNRSRLAWRMQCDRRRNVQQGA